MECIGRAMLSPQCSVDEYSFHGPAPQQQTQQQQPRRHQAPPAPQHRATLPAASPAMSPYARPHHRQQQQQQHHQQQAGLRSAGSSKIDPSFKSKRYRDKLREQIKALENLLPIDKATLHRKLDSQTVFRLVISYFRTKVFFQVAGFSSTPTDEGERGGPLPCPTREHHKASPGGARREELGAESACRDFCDRSEVQLALEALDGFLLVVTSDGTILYSTENISSHLGFHQVDLVHRCLYGIVHPDDHHDLKAVLEQTLGSSAHHARSQVEMGFGSSCRAEAPGTSDACKLSFLCRMKCFNGTSTGFVKMHCCGSMHSFPGAVKSSRTSCQVLFLAFRPFTALAQDTDIEFGQNVFWSKHEMDLGFKVVDTRAYEILGFDSCELEGRSMYDMMHPHDLAAMYTCHKALIDTEEMHALYFRLMKKDASWVWLHTKAKVISKSARKQSILFTHCSVRETDSTYLQQEAEARARYGFDEYLKVKHLSASGSEGETTSSPPQVDCNQTKRRWTSNDTYVVASQSPYKLKDDYSASLHSPHGACPSTYHQSSDRHSPVYPSTYAPHRYQKASQGVPSPLDKVMPEPEPLGPPPPPPPASVNFYDYAHEDFLAAPQYQPAGAQPHPALSMYQMVAHLPPEMYDADSYRKHALMIMESHHHHHHHSQLAGAGLVPAYHSSAAASYQLPLTPQTSPQSFYPQAPFPSSPYPDPLTGGHPMGLETLSPPPSPTRGLKAACMYSSAAGLNSGDSGCSKTPDSLYPADCCKAEYYSEHYPSLLVNGAVQVKVVDGLSYPRTQYANGYSHEYPHGDQYSSESSCLYADQYEADIELKPFQRLNGLAPAVKDVGVVAYAEAAPASAFTEHGFRGNKVAHDRERCLPCPMANTKNGCLAPKVPLTPGEVRIASPASSLPPIGSFLDFLNEDTEMTPIDEQC